MTTIMLGIGPIEIIFFLTTYVVLFISALVCMAKKEKNGWRFLIWVAVLLVFPFLGPIAYLIYYFTNRPKKITA